MIEDIKLKLKKHNQEHLLDFYNELNEDEKKHLLNQINALDFEMLASLYSNINDKKTDDVITSMSSKEDTLDYTQLGNESISEYAVVTMAGGQGTRLGCNGPKGTYMLNYGIDKSLFEIQCDKLKKLYKEFNIYVPWYIMTSFSNNQDTVNFFEQKNYYNYPKDKIKFFIQEELPMIDTQGKIIMDAKFNIKMGANGSGGVFSAITNNGILNDLKQNNIKWIFIGGIDNILLPIDNLDLVGFAKKENYLVASKIIIKGYPEEKVGVFCKRNGKPSVIEYIEMTPELNNLKDDNGNLIYKDAHILCNLFNVQILEDIANKKLPYVPAFKKTSYINTNGELIDPDKENAYKFECFIFDAFSYVDEVGLLKDIREEIFAPIKNATGVDSPETASKLYLNYYK